MLNQCNFIGRVGQDPELKSMNNGNRVANFSLAVSEKWKDKTTGERKEKTTWVNIVVFSDGLVNVIEKYVKKGDLLFVSGKFETRSWEDQSGVKKYKTEIVLQGFDSKLVMLGGGGEKARGTQREEEAPAHSPAPETGFPKPDDLENDLPF